MKNGAKERYLVFFWGGLIGAIFFIAIYGAEVLDFTNVEWFMPHVNQPGDLTQHYLGWVFYRKSNWHFPVGLIENLAYPDLISVIYTDSVPLFAFIFKILSGILPADFQYLGFFGIMCFILQGGIGSLLVYHFTEKKAASIISSVFFACSYLMLDRMLRHTALSAQWLVLTALYIWLCKEGNLTHKESAIWWTLLSVAALLIQAYFLPMVWGCLLCSQLSEVIKNKSFKKTAAVIVSAGFFTIAAGYIFGLFYGDVPATMIGLGAFSFNLNGFWNSMGRSAILPQLPLQSEQYEGFAYLGIGMLALCAFCLAYSLYDTIENKKRRVFKKENIPFLLFVIGFVFAAASPIIYFGNSKVEYTVPKVIENVWGMFRCTGRLIWPVYYMIMLLCCVKVVKCLKKKYTTAVLILTAAVLTQLYDQHGFIREVRSKYDNREPYISRLQDTAWKEISQEYRHMMIYPDTLSIYSNKDRYELQIFAERNDISMNIAYLSRNVSQKANQYAWDYFDQIRQSSYDEDTFFVFLSHLPEEHFNLSLYTVDGIVIGVPRPLKCDAEPYARYKIGDTLVDIINDTADKRDKVLLDGWSVWEPMGIWTEGDECGILIYLSELPQEDLKVKLEASDWMPRVSADLYLDGKYISTANMDPENVTCEFDLPKEAVQNTIINLRLKIKNAVSPMELIKSKDGRKLGICVKCIWLEYTK